MSLRKDYLLDRWTIVSERRAKRPDQFKQKVVEGDMGSSSCVFCPGNEEITPAEIGRVVDSSGNWTIRWIPNKFPAVAMDDDSKRKSVTPFKQLPAQGIHDIIIETPNHTEQLWDLDPSRLYSLLSLYKERAVTLSQIKQLNLKYVHIFKNHGKGGGASLRHSHSQIIGLSYIPSRIQEEFNSAKQIRGDAFEKIICSEIRANERIICETHDWVSFCPFAPRFNFEAWIVPKQPIFSFEDLNENSLHELTGHLHTILKKLRELNAPYNYFFHYFPTGRQLKLHLEITPRLNTRAGFEVATDDSIVTVSPEQAAEFYRA